MALPIISSHTRLAIRTWRWVKVTTSQSLTRRLINSKKSTKILKRYVYAATLYLQSILFYISWHNNANAPAYNLIFTWSETGDGWFKYWDMKEQRIVKFEDKLKAQCKGDISSLCSTSWHSAIMQPALIVYVWQSPTRSICTKCLRIQDDVIEDISAWFV